MDAVEGFPLVLAALSAGLYLTMVAGFLMAMRHRRVPPVPQHGPRVSILKPLAGFDDELEENLSSFAALEYPDYEILLGVASVDDRAYPIARKFVDRVGQERAQLIVTDPDVATNPEVAQLLSLEQAATGDIVVVSDSNVRVAPGYLDPLVGELSDPDVAVVSSIVSGTGERTLGAALENLQLGAIVAPGIVASAFITGRIITLGKSMAIRREPLRRIGGFSCVANYLSDDHMLAKVFAEAGYGVRVSLWPVDNRNVSCSLTRTVERHARWAKIRRVIQPAGFALEPALSPVVIAILACLALPTDSLRLAFLSAVVLQTAGAVVTTRRLRGAGPRWYWVPLEVLRSYLLFFCWLGACMTRRVSWRSHEFQLARDSAIVPAEPGIWRRVPAPVRS
jgi:ceramide glucosyltransferase